MMMSYAQVLQMHSQNPEPFRKSGDGKDSIILDITFSSLFYNVFVSHFLHVS